MSEGLEPSKSTKFTLIFLSFNNSLTKLVFWHKQHNEDKLNRRCLDHLC